MPPLRPMLYNRLRARFGEVKIVKEGEATVATAGEYQGRKSLKVSHFGETYCICCPICGDTRYRLWINHLWGRYNQQVDSRNLWMARCYNEECVADFANMRKLEDWVFNDVSRGRNWLPEDIVLAGEIVDVSAMPGRASPPGELIYLHELPDNHYAREYMRGRGFDPDIFSRELEVSFCPLAVDQFSRASERLIIPVIMEGEMKGWQARLLLGKESKFNPKYLTMTGMKKSQTLYNYDEASKMPFIVVTEGPTKVWRWGKEAVATLGKEVNVSGWQIQRLAFWGLQGKPIIILLDGDAKARAQLMYDALKGVPKRVIVPLDDGVDPGDIPTQELRDYVYGVASKAGIDLPTGGY